MTDVLLLSCEGDEEIASGLEAALTAAGYAVASRRSAAGKDAPEAVVLSEPAARDIERCRRAIVVWTPASIGSAELRAQAGRARELRKFTPVRTSEMHALCVPDPFTFHQTLPASDLDGVLASLCEKGVFPRGWDGPTVCEAADTPEVKIIGHVKNHFDDRPVRRTGHSALEFHQLLLTETHSLDDVVAWIDANRINVVGFPLTLMNGMSLGLIRYAAFHSPRRLATVLASVITVPRCSEAAKLFDAATNPSMTIFAAAEVDMRPHPPVSERAFEMRVDELRTYSSGWR